MRKENTSLDKVKADIEILKSESLANAEVRKVNNERFTHITEQIGELRNQINHVEKDHLKDDIRLEKVAGLVETVQPQKLLSQVSKTDMKVEALRSLVEANDFLKSKIMKELKDMRKKFIIFRNLETVKELTDDAKDRYKEMKKLEAKVLKEADEVKLVSKKFDDAFHKIELTASRTDDLEAINREFRNSLTETNDKLDTKVPKSEFVKRLDEERNSIDSNIDKKIEKTSDLLHKDIDRILHKEQFNMIKELINEEIQNNTQVKFQVINARVEQLGSKMDNLKQFYEEKIGDLKNSLKDEINQLKDESDIDPQLQTLLNYVHEAKSSGMDEKSIRVRLQGSGWPTDMIDRAF